MTIDAWATTPTLRGERLLLRPTDLADTPGLARAYDVETTRYFLYGSESGPPTAQSVGHASRSGFRPAIGAPVDFSGGFDGLLGVCAFAQSAMVLFRVVSPC